MLHFVLHSHLIRDSSIVSHIIRDLTLELPKVFAIDIAAYAIMSNQKNIRSIF